MEPIFKTPRGADAEKALAFCSRGLAGAEMYTFLKLDGAFLPEGRFWCAESGGEVIAAVFNNGDRTIEKAEGKAPYPGVCVGSFMGAPPAAQDAAPLSPRDVFAAYMLLNGGGTLSNANAERYVYRARALREGLAYGYGVFAGGALASFAFIVAQNADSALLGDVFTEPAHRGRGFASRCVLESVRAALSAGRTPYLLCTEELRPFYARLGFAFGERKTGVQEKAEDG